MTAKTKAIIVLIALVFVERLADELVLALEDGLLSLVLGG